MAARARRVRQALAALRRRLRPPRRLSFTRDGRLIVLIALGVGFAAINTGNNLLYLLLAWLLSFIIASGVLSEVTMRGLRVRRRPPPRIYAGKPFLMEIAVENEKPSLASFSIEVEDLIRGRPLDKKCYFLKIPAGKTQRTAYRHTFPRRGTYYFDGFRVATRFPFGLFCKSRDVDEAGEVLVYPAMVPVPRPAPRGDRAGTEAGRRLGGHGEFWGLREWREGDDRRDVHWRSSARKGRLLVREYQDERHRRIVIVLDHAMPPAIRAALDSGEVDAAAQAADDAVERAVSVAASLCAVHLEAGWSVELVARDLYVPTGTGRPQRERILRALAVLPAVSDDTPFAAQVPRIDSVLVTPRGIAATGRPNVGSVMEP